MPNWVNNTMTVSGKEADLKTFMEKAGKSYTTYHKGVRTKNEDGTWSYDSEAINESLHEAPISFMNFTTPEDLDAYYGASDYKPEGYDSMSMEERMACAMKFSSDGWYDWNVRNWGTKWDACNPGMNGENPADGELLYYFDTAWSPAEGAYRQMVEQHPELHFHFRCVEEQGWGVEYVGEDGKLSVSNEWDIPESHAEWEAVDEECRACSWFDGENFDDLYDDCPNKPRATAEEIEALEDILETI